MAAKPKGLFIIALLTILGSPKPAACETLRQVLAANGIDSRGLDASRLDQKITSYAVLNDPAVFCVASYENDGTNFLTNILNFDVFEKSAKNWVHREIETERLTCDNRHFHPGSILEIQRSRSYFYLRTHANPSAGYTLIYTKDLKFHDAVYGCLLATFNDGTMVYHNSQIHFAPTHYTEISIYNPYSKRRNRSIP